MEILAAFDLTGSLRAAAELVGCSHHTVAAHVAARDAGRLVGTSSRRVQVTDEYLDKIGEWDGGLEGQGSCRQGAREAAGVRVRRVGPLDPAGGR
jgi:hypothetical protein